MGQSTYPDREYIFNIYIFVDFAKPPTCNKCKYTKCTTKKYQNTTVKKYYRPDCDPDQEYI